MNSMTQHNSQVLITPISVFEKMSKIHRTYNWQLMSLAGETDRIQFALKNANVTETGKQHAKSSK